MLGSCRLSNTGNKILFRINWQCVHQGFNVSPTGRSALVWGLVTWEAKPLASFVKSSDYCEWWWDVTTLTTHALNIQSWLMLWLIMLMHGISMKIDGEMFSDLTCKVRRSPIMLEPHVSPDWQQDFFQHFW